MDKLELCIFDMDGLLIDSEKKMWMTNGKTVLESFGKKPDITFFKSIMGMSTWSTEKLFKDFFGEDFDTVEYYKKVYELNAAQIERGDIPLMPGAIELLDYLKENNIKRTIATSTKREVATKVINKLGLDKYFDLITCGDEVSNSKPAPDIYLKALDKFKTKPENAFVFEDANSGGLAALRANIPLILVPDIATISDEVYSKAYKVIPSLDKAIDIIKETL